MNAYLSMKYQADDTEEVAESLRTAAERAGFQVTMPVRDFDDYGRGERDPADLFPFMVNGLEHAQVLLVDTTDKGVGIGFEAGYAAAIDLPIVVMHYVGSEVSPVLAAAAQMILEYESYEQLFEQLQSARRQLQEEQ